ncbi:UNVERIFIED_CONTAM: hypothetical protein Slati_4328800 [Sesamum latifolium]|uniref:WRKY19-like zinc finger domain-containing protein n=1 Tax=Sesamum latifolium TaxID=2727402 RepID=A0AAW2SPR0_9LAMI
MVARDARERTAQRVLKVFLVFAYLMEVVADVSILNAKRGTKEAQCFARLTEVANVAHIQGAIKVQKEAPLSAKGMVEENDAHSKEVGFVQRVSMEGPFFCVTHGGGKRCAVPKCTKSARGRTDFCVRHGGGKRCKFEGCGKVLKEAQISARLMVEGRDACGVTLVLNLAKVMYLATYFCSG